MVVGRSPERQRARRFTLSVRDCCQHGISPSAGYHRVAIMLAQFAISYDGAAGIAYLGFFYWPILAAVYSSLTGLALSGLSPEPLKRPGRLSTPKPGYLAFVLIALAGFVAASGGFLLGALLAGQLFARSGILVASLAIATGFVSAYALQSALLKSALMRDFEECAVLQAPIMLAWVVFLSISLATLFGG